jgi:hypothetical protein
MRKLAVILFLLFIIGSASATPSYTVTGDANMSPVEAKGNYTYVADYNGFPYYQNANGYCLWYLYAPDTYIIASTLGIYANGYWVNDYHNGIPMWAG